uniref:sialidase family protein n=1 Tax=Lysinibacillus sp. D4B2_S17 TaxID=2941225 RepID=UPI0020BD61BF
GHLRAAWSSKNTAYPTSTNSRYAKSIDGGVTWSTPEQITNENDQYKFFEYPSIVVVNGKPLILTYGRNATTSFISFWSFDGSTW